jgi:hypothetical protein
MVENGRLMYLWRYEVRNVDINPLQGRNLIEVAKQVRKP